MNHILSSNFATSVPFASVICSVLYMIYGNPGLFILAGICVALPAILFLGISVYIFFQFGRHSTIELELDSLQLGLIQIATLLVTINCLMLFFNNLDL
jgi:hypothetical protein